MWAGVSRLFIHGVNYRFRLFFNSTALVLKSGEKTGRDNRRMSAPIASRDRRTGAQIDYTARTRVLIDAGAYGDRGEASNRLCGDWDVSLVSALFGDGPGTLETRCSLRAVAPRWIGWAA
jgi:hypothetical protein